jgi:hypothetical protein
MIRSAAKSTFVVQKSRKAGAGTHQVWDQSKVWNQLDESSANLVVRVKRGGEAPIVEVVSGAFKNGPALLKVEFRQVRPQGDGGRGKLVHSAFKSRFKRHISDLKTNTETPKAPELVEGEVVELQACLIDEARTTLYPYRHHVIANADRARSVLLMHEVLGSLIASHRSDDRHPEHVYDYSVAVAAKGEARQITDILAEASSLTEYLDPSQSIRRGFLLRGKETPDAGVQIGVACLRTSKDDQQGARANEVMMQFMKQRSHLFLKAMNPDNPWEVMPIYSAEGAKATQEKLDTLANKAPYLVSQEGVLGNMNFAHMNIVLDIGSLEGRPKVIHANLCRSRPLVLDTSLPDKARERSLKTKPAPELAASA